MHTPKQHTYWFRRRRFGWGWRPATWHGWVVTSAYVLGVIGIIVHANIRGITNDTDAVRGIVFPIVALAFLFIAIAWRTGEPLRFQWGSTTHNDAK